MNRLLCDASERIGKRETKERWPINLGLLEGPLSRHLGSLWPSLPVYGLPHSDGVSNRLNSMV